MRTCRAIFLSFLLVSVAYANSISALTGKALAGVHTKVFLDPNDGSGGNFAAIQRGSGYKAVIFGGLPYQFYNYGPYYPGDTVGGDTSLYLEESYAVIGKHTYDLGANGVGDLVLTSFTFPTNDKSFTVPVTISFYAPMIIDESGTPFNVSGFAKGKMRFSFDKTNGFYFASSSFFTTPEPSTLGLMGTGLLALLISARKRLRT